MHLDLYHPTPRTYALPPTAYDELPRPPYAAESSDILFQSSTPRLITQKLPLLRHRPPAPAVDAPRSPRRGANKRLAGEIVQRETRAAAVLDPVALAVVQHELVVTGGRGREDYGWRGECCFGAVAGVLSLPPHGPDLMAAGHVA